MWRQRVNRVIRTTATKSRATTNQTIRTAYGAKERVAHALTSSLTGQAFPHTHPHLFPSSNSQENFLEEEITVGFTRGEFINRRQKLRQKYLTQDNQLLILPATVQSIMTSDIPYTYRADSNLYYLTGCMEQEAILLLGKGTDANWLFVRDKNGKEEQWHGPRSGVKAMHELVNGHNNTNPDLIIASVSQFPMVVKALLMQATSSAPPVLYFDPKKNNAVTEAIVSAVGGSHRFASSIDDAEKNGKIIVQVPDTIMNNMRGIKSEQELQMLKRVADISNQAFQATMSLTSAGMSEGHLEAIMEFYVRLLGAQRLAYPPVVATGNNANVIHYVRNNSTLQDGDLVLIDGGAEYFLYPSDVTRAWPVNGKFNEAQRLLYQAVLEVNKSCIDLLAQKMKNKQKVTIGDLHNFSADETNRRLKESLGLGGLGKEMLDALYPHGLGHPLGMDIHEEVPAWTQPIVPGMVITIEPGIYIPASESLFAPTRINRQLLGNGVRIEDNVFIHEDGVDVITGSIPKEIDQIEEICAKEHPLKQFILSNYRH